MTAGPVPLGPQPLVEARLREAALRDWLAAYLQAAGCAVDVEQSVGADSGIADLVVRNDGRVAAIEVKADGDRRSLCTALGQALVYRADGATHVGVVTPATPVTAEAILSAYEQAGVQLLEIPLQNGQPPQPGTLTALARVIPSLGWPWGQVPRPYAHLRRSDPRPGPDPSG